MEKIKNKLLKRTSIPDIITKDADVYTEDNRLLLKFRKNNLNKQKIDDFYNNVIEFAKKSYTSNRGSASGSNKKKHIGKPKSAFKCNWIYR